MKPTTYINWDGLKDIPFFYCDTHLLFFRQRIERDGIKMLANLLFSKVPANS